MARLPRLVVAGQAHYVIQRGQGAGGSRPVFVDDIDRAAYLAALREAAATERVQVHAYALLPTEVQLLATPERAESLGRMVQALGRRYVSTYNRRHAHRGTVWDGRFRCAVVEPGSTRLAVMRLIDGQEAEPGATSAGQRTGDRPLGWLADPPEFWALGNTPFDREAAYRRLLQEGLPTTQAEPLRRAALGGWAAGTPVFAVQVGEVAARPASPRPRGRPRTRGV